MRTKNVASILGMALCLFSPLVFGEKKADSDKPENGMYLLWSMGDLVKSRDPRPNKTQVWENEVIYELVGGLVMNSSPVDKLRLMVNFEIASYNLYPREPLASPRGEIIQDTQFSTYIEEAKGVFTFGEIPPKAFQVEFGYFLNRYNTNARVFGEYLFRSMIYPSIIFNSFDYPWYPLSGVRIGHDFAEYFHHDLFVLTEFDHYPYFDFSIAYTAGFNFKNILELGAGINMKRIMPVRPSLTTPNHPLNTYVQIPAQGPVAISKHDLSNPDSIIALDTVVIENPITGFIDGGGGRFRQVGDSLLDDRTVRGIDGRLAPELKAEVTNFTFSGTLIMGRIGVRPLAWMDDANLSNLVSLYSEVGVLGWENQSFLYENRRERVPIMGGIQLSFPKILDVLAFEVEHFPSKTIPSYFNRGRFNIPIPGAEEKIAFNNDSLLAAEANRLKKDDFKWIVYAKKSFPGISVVLQAGTDHMRRSNGEYGENYDEILTRPSEWYYQMKIRIPN